VILNKAPDAFRTISEVAEELDVPQHVLRFWESRFQQIRPMKRGGGRRYYRPDDVDLLRGIRHLLYGEGYTIRGVQRILRDQGSKFVQGVWQVGAEQPQRAPEEDAEAVEGFATAELADEIGAPSGDPEPGLPSPGRPESSFTSPPRPAQAAAPASSALDPEDVRKLGAVIDELMECRRIIDAALSGRGQ